MAKYEREFLVPYLMNVCSLHLVYRKLCEKESVLLGESNRLRNGVTQVDYPSKPWIEPLPPGGVFLAVMGCITFLMSFLMFSIDCNFMGWFFIFGGIMEGIMGYVQIHSVKESNTQKENNYNRKMAEYNEIMRKNEQAKNAKLPYVLNDLRKCQLEKKKASEVLTKVYGVNIIPSQYRNICASLYLYRWFNSSQADDLEMALSMFVLEEIKDKLDTIIRNQYSIILNQQIAIANQQKTLEQQQQYSAMMCEKLDKIEASNEERNMYLGMIESHTATSAYFAAAEYIRHI